MRARMTAAILGRIESLRALSSKTIKSHTGLAANANLTFQYTKNIVVFAAVSVFGSDVQYDRILGIEPSVLQGHY